MGRALHCTEGLKSGVQGHIRDGITRCGAPHQIEISAKQWSRGEERERDRKEEWMDSEK